MDRKIIFKWDGRWQNQFGSQLMLKVDSDNRVTGKFHTAVGRGVVKNPEVWFEVTGFVNHEVISLTVSYGPRSGAVSAMIGRSIHEEGLDRMEIIGHTAYGTEPGIPIGEDSWQRIITTINHFQRLDDWNHDSSVEDQSSLF